MKKILCVLLILCMLIPTAISEEKRVYKDGETEPFPEGTELLAVWVCPLMGADCMLMTLGEHSMLIDTGHNGDHAKLMDMFSQAGCQGVEFTVITHPHDDHAGGVKPLLNAGFDLGTVINFFPHEYQDTGVIQVQTLRALNNAGVPVEDLKTGDVIPFGDAEVTAYRVPDGSITRLMNCNDLSALLMVRYGECSILLTADVDKRSQPVLAALYDLKTDILKYPHHGLTVMHDDFLKETDPEFVFFTHSTWDTRDAQRYLVRRGYNDMTFATWGLIRMQTDGHKWIVTQYIKPGLEQLAETYVPGKAD